MEQIINNAWENKTDSQEAIDTVKKVVAMLDLGKLKMCEKNENEWKINNWLRKAILLYFKYMQNRLLEQNSFDKISSKFESWKEEDFIKANIRIVPGANVRYGAYLAPGSIILPSFINIGSSIESGTMIDSNVTVGTCATIGKNCHIGAGTTIGGVLEPFTASPVIIEDNVFVGANCSITEGIIVRSGAVFASGVHVSCSTRIYDTVNDKMISGYIPENAVVVPGTMPRGNVSISCALIVKYADEKTRNSTALNEIFRL